MKRDSTFIGSLKISQDLYWDALQYNMLPLLEQANLKFRTGQILVLEKPSYDYTAGTYTAQACKLRGKNIIALGAAHFNSDGDWYSDGSEVIFREICS